MFALTHRVDQTRVLEHLPRELEVVVNVGAALLLAAGRRLVRALVGRRLLLCAVVLFVLVVATVLAGGSLGLLLGCTARRPCKACSEKSK